MKTTRYFEEQVLRKRPYIDRAMCVEVLSTPLRRATQDDGRMRFWGPVLDARDGQQRILRDVTLEDGETVQCFLRPRLRNGPAMKLHYYPETDSLYIELKLGAGVETREIASGLNADFDASEVVVGLDIDHASLTLDLTSLETIALPVHNSRVA